MKHPVKVGELFDTYGGWSAVVVWKNQPKCDEGVSFIVVHKPETEEECFSLCDEDGVAHSVFSVNEPPTYDVHHPADLILDF
jgi:hypothetical protein